LEEAATIVGDGGDKEGAGSGGSRGFRHADSIGVAGKDTWCGRSIVGVEEGSVARERDVVRKKVVRKGPRLRGPQDAEEESAVRKKADESLRAARFTPAFPPQRASSPGTPAFGRADAPSARLFLARVNAGPSVRGRPRKIVVAYGPRERGPFRICVGMERGWF
jgi:hypothetical protein